MTKLRPQADQLLKDRRSFFPNSKDAQKAKQAEALEQIIPKRNSLERQEILQGKTGKDVQVDIPTGIKDFSRIKRAVEKAAPIDNSQKIASLKQRINSGEYKVDYDAVADRLLKEEFLS